MTLRDRIDRRTALTVAAATLAATALPGAASGSVVLAAMRGDMRLRGPDLPATPIWGYGGAAPGPTIRARVGGPVAITLQNRLDEPTGLHFHGARVENRVDGVPGLTEAALAPGADREIAFRPRDAGTVLYRASHPEFGAGQIARGLVGLLVVEEAAPQPFDQDVALLINDWALDAGGAIADLAAPVGREGRAGQVLTVNGARSNRIVARAGARLRLRLANASLARLVRFSAPGVVLTLIALDGQPSELFPLQDSTIFLGPGQRADLVLDVAGPPGGRIAALFSDLGEAASPLEITIADEPPLRAAPFPPIVALPANPISPTLDMRRAVRAQINLHQRGGEAAMDGRVGWALPAAPTFRARRGSTIAIGVANDTDRIYAFHLHGHQARLLDGMDDGWKPFFLDTVMIAPRQTARLAFIADSPGRWLMAAQALFAPGQDRIERPLHAWFEVT